MPKEGWYRDPVAERWWDGVDWTRLVRISGEDCADGPTADEASVSPAGWQPDPYAERFWDGSNWTTETRVKASLPPGLLVSVVQDEAPVEIVTGGLEAGPETANDDGAKPAAPSPKLKQIAAASITIALIALVVALVARAGGASDEQQVITAPVGAKPVPVSGGFLRTASGEAIEITVASCGGLRARVEASDCLEAEFGDTLHALTFAKDAGKIRVNVYSLTSESQAPEASLRMTGIVADESQLSSSTDVHAYLLGLVSGDAFAILVESRRGSDVESTVEFVGLDPTGSLATLAVYQGRAMNLAIDSDRVHVQTANNDESDTYLAHNIYPLSTGWLAVDEVIDSEAARAFLYGRDVVLFSAATDGLSPVTQPETSPTSSLPATAAPTTAPPETVPPSGLISGLSLECDGSWITIVSSQPGERVQAALNNYPGAYAVRNEESCASLNPYFSSGNYAGQPIFVVFYGPYFDRYSAQEQCLSLGKTSKSSCYVAPLTNNPADRTVRYGPND